MIKRIALASAMAICGTTANAVPLDFYFSFTEAVQVGNPTVTGVLRGVSDDATSTPASVEILTISVESQYSPGTVGAIDTSPEGEVAVSSGEITSVDSLFADFDPDGDLLADETLLFDTRNVSGEDVVLASFISFSLFQPEPNSLSVVSFSREPFVTPIPLPAGALLLLSGIGGLTILRANRGR